MELDIIRQQLQRQPFRPFVMQLNDDRFFRVEHPELLIITDRNLTLTNPEDGTAYHLDPMLIPTIHVEIDADSYSS